MSFNSWYTALSVRFVYGCLYLSVAYTTGTIERTIISYIKDSGMRRSRNKKSLGNQLRRNIVRLIYGTPKLLFWLKRQCTSTWFTCRLIYKCPHRLGTDETKYGISIKHFEPEFIFIIIFVLYYFTTASIFYKMYNIM